MGKVTGITGITGVTGISGATVVRTYLELPGTAGNDASVEDNPVLDIASDIEIISVCYCTVNPVTGRLTTKFGAAGNRAYVQYLVGGATGSLTLQISPDGTVQALGNPVVNVNPLTNTLVALRSNWRKSDGRFQQFKSFDYDPDDVNSGTWTQIGADVIDTAAAAGIFNSTARLRIGFTDGGGGTRFTGRFYRSQIFNGLLANGGVKVFDADFTRGPVGATTLFDLVNGLAITINQSGGTPARIVAQ